MNLIEESNKKFMEADASSVDDIIRLLDNYAESGGSRMKLQVVEGDGNVISRKYHHGRCDVGSPWATGQAFDVLDCGD
ncbi:MAG: hypothetical protein NC092_04035 [Butyrivibrio sp.]|nr:hypothetical protein [Muribaculum sp.]MCM1551844.1 hypothetical protein [Butyrivibrio sp.]